MAFPELHPSLLRALAAKNYVEPTPVQQAVLRPEAAGRDLLVSAQTGSGKTAAYGLTLGETLLGERRDLGGRSIPLRWSWRQPVNWRYRFSESWRGCWARQAGASSPAWAAWIFAASNARSEWEPMSWWAHRAAWQTTSIKDSWTSLKYRAVVLDEADEMLDFGFREELELLMNATPTERRTMMFSATLPKAILAWPGSISAMLCVALSAETGPHVDIEYRAFLIGPRDTEHAVVNIAALLRCARRAGVLLHARGGAASARESAGARILRGCAVGRAETA